MFRIGNILKIFCLLTACQAKNIILVGTGDSTGGDGFEFVDLDNLSSTCNVPTAFPNKIRGAIGSYVEGKAIVCGGHDVETDLPQLRCYNYDPVTNEWTEDSIMIGLRHNAYGTMRDDGTWWLTGGEGAEYSTDVYEEGGFSYGPGIAVKAYEHCMVDLSNDYSLLVAGGDEIIGHMHVWKFNWRIGPKQSWIRKENLADERMSPSCGRLDTENNTFVYAAGGKRINTEVFLNSTEYFDTEAEQWHDGPSLPVGIYDGEMLVLDDNLYIIGGETDDGKSGDIYWLDWDNQEWNLVGSLQNQYSGHVAIGKLGPEFDNVCS